MFVPLVSDVSLSLAFSLSLSLSLFLFLFLSLFKNNTCSVVTQGVRCATEWGLQREVGFYQSIGRLQDLLPCPTSVALGSNFAANRLCLAMDYVGNGVVTPDHVGANLHQATSVVNVVARMHGTFW